MTELPSFFQVYIPGPYEDPESDMSPAIGEFRNFTVAGHMSLVSPRGNIVNVDRYPGSPALAYRIILNETDLGYYLSPIGSRRIQVVIYFLGTVPILTGFASIRIYQCAFYAVKVNKYDRSRKGSILPMTAPSRFRQNRSVPGTALENFKNRIKCLMSLGKSSNKKSNTTPKLHRRTILIATMEYDIDDWEIKIDIGGLGAMA